MSFRYCVNTSRIITTSPICLFCQCFSRRRCYPAKKLMRYYAAAANATQVNPNTLSTSTKSSTSSLSNDADNVTSENSRPQRNPSKKNAETQARKEEIRRKALATLDKSTKFIAAGLGHSKVDPTLADLDSFKPESPPLFEIDFIYPEATAFLRPRAPKDSALDKYGVMFEKLVDTLTSKFNKQQLVALYKQGIERPTPKGQGQPRPMKKLKTARDFAAEIVRWRWKWPYLKEIVDRKTYLTSTAERVFSLRAHEFFLLLGPNGSTFQELTDQYGVVLKQVERTDTGFSLLVSGLCYSLDQLAIVLAKRREQIITEIITPESFLGSINNQQSIHEDSLRRISKHADALVEEMPNGMFQISALDIRNINTAKRLVTRTRHQLMHRPPSFAVIGDPKTVQYSLFPLETYRPDRMPLQWNPSKSVDILNPNHTISNTGNSRIFSPETYNSASLPSIFRMRKIIDSLGVTSSPQISDDTVAITAGLHDIGEWVVFIRRLSIGSNPHASPATPFLEPRFLSEPGWNTLTSTAKLIKNKFGHIAFIPNGVFRCSLTSPLQAPFSFFKLFQWMQDNSSRIAFIPEIPSSLTNFTVSARNTYTRLIYRVTTNNITESSSPQRILKLDIKPNNDQRKDYPRPLPSSSSSSLLSSATKTSTASLDLTADFRDMFTDENKGLSGIDYDYPIRDNLELHKKEQELLSPTVQIWDGTENVVDVALPTRPVDIRFSTLESLRIPLSDLPTEMQDYITKFLSSSPDSPLSLSPPLKLQYKNCTYTLDRHATIRSSIHNNLELPVITEEVTDIESNERFMRCLVNCVGASNSRDWKAFLNCCNNLSGNPF